MFHFYGWLHLKIKIYEIYNIWYKNLDHIHTTSILSWKIKNLTMTVFRFKQIIRKSASKYSHMIKCLLLTIRKLKKRNKGNFNKFTTKMKHVPLHENFNAFYNLHSLIKIRFHIPKEFYCREYYFVDNYRNFPPKF